MSALGQLALPFPHRPDYTASDFLSDPSNAEALAWLGRSAVWPGRRLVLWGEAACGKSHLLHRWAAARGVPVHTRADLADAAEAMTHDALALDEADVPGDERALLFVLNRAADRGAPVLMAARQAPARWPIRLADLASRVRASGAVRIRPPDDAFLRALFTRLLAERGLKAGPSVQDWLLARLPRSPAAIREATVRLDRTALARGCGISRAVAAEVLASFGLGTDEFADGEGGPGSSDGGL
ncbi:MAG: chromosomal replication initiator DnaA, partial [Alphaproteobacteria bacterium]|nr:chromosomal replication initiator DnaA [Alphaproteobacteria bacterium]